MISLIRRIPPILVLCVGLPAAVLSVFGTYWNWASLVGGIIAALLFIVQYVTQGNVEVKFSENDWRETEDGFVFSAGRSHGKGRNPNVAIYEPSDSGGYEQVICDVIPSETGEVRIKASKPFVGELRIS